MHMKYLLLLALISMVLSLPTAARAAGLAVTPQMREELTRKLGEQCLRQERDFAAKGYTKAQTEAICRCSTQQTGALLNSRTVEYILKHGVMPADMQRKAASATRGCIRSVTLPRKP